MARGFSAAPPGVALFQANPFEHPRVDASESVATAPAHLLSFEDSTADTLFARDASQSVPLSPLKASPMCFAWARPSIGLARPS